MDAIYYDAIYTIWKVYIKRYSVMNIKGQNAGLNCLERVSSIRVTVLI